MEREYLLEIYSQRFVEAQGILNDEIEKPEPAETDELLEDLDAKWSTLFRLYETVINESEIDQLEPRINAMKDFRTQYIKSRKAVERKKGKAPSTSTSNSSTDTSHHDIAAAKVPTFSGEAVKWPEF